MNKLLLLNKNVFRSFYPNLTNIWSETNFEEKRTGNNHKTQSLSLIHPGKSQT